jgi:hypothetical protein
MHSWPVSSEGVEGRPFLICPSLEKDWHTSPGLGKVELEVGMEGAEFP